MFDIILQNSASKKEYLVSGLKDTGNWQAYVFEGFKMPDSAPFGEYYGALIWNGRDDVEYDFRDVLLDTVLHTGEGDVLLRDLRPEIFVLRYGQVEPAVIYREKDTEFIYYKK